MAEAYLKDKKRGNSDTHQREGQNVLYGDGHVVYKDDVKDRAVYQFTAKGALRRDPLLVEEKDRTIARQFGTVGHMDEQVRCNFSVLNEWHRPAP